MVRFYVKAIRFFGKYSTMGRRTTVEERELIIFHYNSGKSQRKIAEIVNKSPSTVQHIIERFTRENRVTNKPRLPPNKIFTDREEQLIVREVHKNPTLSAPKLTTAMEERLGKKCNPETVRRILRKANFHGRTARNKPLISEKNRRFRKEFAIIHQNKDIEFWKTVLFADESKFNIFGSDGKITVWRKPREELRLRNLRPTVKHGGGHVMVWGCMSHNGVGNLHFIEGVMDKNMYLNILRQNLQESAAKLGIKDCFRFYQDNDPKHSSFIVREWLLYNCPHVVKTPAQSPDLNVIEHVWALLKEKIKKYTIKNKNDLKNALLKEWGEITPEFTKKLVESIPNRLKEVKKQNGGPTKY